MLKSKSAILKSLGNWDYDEISVQDPNSEAAVIKVIQCGICSTDVIRSMEVGFYNYPIVPGHEIVGRIFKLGNNKSSLKEGDKVCVYPLIHMNLKIVVVYQFQHMDYKKILIYALNMIF